ncbi:MAG: bifunctional [glutamate--ammonia ligase]-adenylyl-L-tyrosine phosphorylase/[glutamate--ammonia-ligase] adenylyltransferase [Pseudomonadota bacterium]
MVFSRTDMLALPPELVDAVSAFGEQFEARFTSAEQPPGLLRTVASSAFARRVLLAQWPEITRELEAAPGEVLRAFEQRLDADEPGPDVIRCELRRFRDRFMVRLLIDELGQTSDVEDTLHALSDLADVCVRIASRTARTLVAERFGELLDVEGKPIPLVVVAMGKLGGRELNFSSDIDVVFLYPRDGQSNGRRSASAQEYCMRWSQQLVGLLDDITTDGQVFRVDTRLRPFGDSGPPVCSYAALEQYLLAHGRAWERYAWMKARICGDLPPDDDCVELQDKLVRPFVFRRYLDYGLIASLREMHGRIDAERRGLGDNLKLGNGGIRQIEFMVQSLQMLRGGSRPEYRQRGLLQALDCLSGSAEMPADRAQALRSAYRFLRRLENLVQAHRDQQVHDIPSGDGERSALAFALRLDDWEGLASQLEEHRGLVAREFEALAYRDGAGDSELRDAWLDDATNWSDRLAPLPEAATNILRDFREQAIRQRPDEESTQRLAEFIPRLVSIATKHEDPVLVLSRSTAFLTGIIRRSAYIALLNENPVIAHRLCDLLSSSAYIAEQLTQHPALLDELIDPRVDEAAFTRQAFDASLREALASNDPSDSEACTEALARFQRATMFRIAVAEISGQLPLMKASDGLTWLAEAVLTVALDIAWRDVSTRYGEPHYTVDGVRQPAGFGIVAYGKLGGLELSYGSDLDLVFVHDSVAEQAFTDGDKSIDNAVFFARLAQRLTHILTTRTTSGVLYDIDTRLRPSGRSGLLVTSLMAFDRYQRDDAWTWEHQALLRSRPVAGSVAIADAFERIRVRALSSYVNRDSLGADVVSMRERMRRELDRSRAGRFDLKQGRGGIADIEFLVQFLVLQVADTHPSTVQYSDNIRQLDALNEAGCIDSVRARQLQDIYKAYRQAVHRRVLDRKDRLVNNAQFVEERAAVSAFWDDTLGVFAAVDGQGD